MYNPTKEQWSNPTKEQWFEIRREKKENYIRFKHLKIIIRNLKSTMNDILTDNIFNEHDVISYEIYRKYDITAYEYYSIILQRIIQTEFIIVKNTRICNNDFNLTLLLIQKISLDKFKLGIYLPKSRHYLKIYENHLNIIN